ncbi:MAG TPA: peptidoglycan-binding domain-containing protein [Candidatus Omnitrophota bacterium]|nr:peptidoglycan-binding domain-containing protein [Candidatus Omnitrophota bacterium]
MKRAIAAVFIACSLVITGCATTQSGPGTAGASSDYVKELQAKITSLETDLNRQRDENYVLRKKLEEYNRGAVRMPNAGEIQTALKNAGFFKGVIDGKIGSQTKEAVRKFQEANGLNPDGNVGSKTWALLSKYLKQ